MLYAEGNFLCWGLCIFSFRAMSSANKVVHAEDTFCYMNYVCQISKLQHMNVKPQNTPGYILLHATAPGFKG